MRKPAQFHSLRGQTGFSLIEMMVVVGVLTIIMASVFKSIDLTQQTSRTQQVKLDVTQQAREFIDQLTRDLRNSGYPYQRNMAGLTTDPNNAAYKLGDPTDPYNAPGLLFVDKNALWFAGNVDGTEQYVGGVPQGLATVKIIRYDYVVASPGSPNCPCLRRTEFQRNGGDPIVDAGAPPAGSQQLEIQNVQNGTSAADAIFTVYDDTGAALGLPLDFDNNATSIASINSLKIVLTVQGLQPDSTGVRPVTTVVSSVALGNCSEALGNGNTPTYCQ